MVEKDFWTTTIVVIVSVIAVKIGVDNLEWGLNAVGWIDTLPSKTHQKAR
ncbi:hypothetical protein NUACC21_45480 [Scytonema sp. NUACC21]